MAEAHPSRMPPSNRPTANGSVSERALVRLMRFALPANVLRPQTVAHEPDGARAVQAPTLRLVREDGALRAVAPALVDEAVARGLLGRGGDGILRPLPEARAFLRRAAAELEEQAFRGQHGEVVPMPPVPMPTPVSGDPVTGPRRDLAESPLGPLSRLKDRDGTAYFPKEAVAAGERLAEEFERAGLQPRVTASWEPRLADGARRRGPPSHAVSDGAAAAQRRFARACAAIGPELSGVAIDVCCFGKGLEMVERERQWPARSAKLMLRTALQALARHYAPPVHAKSRSWGAEDYRPRL